MEKLLKALVLLIGVASCFVAGPVLADDLFSDADFKAYEEAYFSESRACLKLKKSAERNACKVAHKKKFAGDPRQRGSKAYFEKHYKPLDYNALQERYMELTVLKKKAPTFPVWGDRPYGVLSQRIIASELHHIELLQGERELVMYCEDNKERLKKLNMSMSRLPQACKQYYAEKAVEKKLAGKGLK